MEFTYDHFRKAYENYVICLSDMSQVFDILLSTNRGSIWDSDSSITQFADEYVKLISLHLFNSLSWTETQEVNFNDFNYFVSSVLNYCQMGWTTKEEDIYEEIIVRQGSDLNSLKPVEMFDYRNPFEVFTFFHSDVFRDAVVYQKTLITEFVFGFEL